MPNIRFQALLLEFSEEPDVARRAQLERTLWDEYGQEATVLVLDMSGFSQLTHRYGLVHYLSMVRRMQLTADPIVRGCGGTPVKFEADNCFAMFPTVDDALACALALNDAFDKANEATPDELDIRIAIGIDHGRILVVDGNDFFGHPVNRASKLGEDLARPGEVLVTAEAAARASSLDGYILAPQAFTASGLHIDAYAIARRG
ncbi:MAG TPA: adenylate/guanylate cyclase domain-containing protein [Xanthomonadales bacterium]|nr:adenylate/guanylate cyclase domain-containing protein [Xanthomonadales bacterium]